MDNNSIEVEVPGIFYECFQKAIDKLLENKKEIEIVSEKETKTINVFIITVKSKDPVNFYHLGKAYATEREKV